MLRLAGARRRALVLGALAASVVLAPTAARAVIEIPEVRGEAAGTVDVRKASVEPTQAQRAAVTRLGATVRWSEFGTPQSLLRYGGFLAEGIDAGSATEAARSWLAANKGLFRLASTAGLNAVSDHRLTGSKGRAVVFEETVDGLPTSPDGALTVGVVGTKKAGWSVAYVSSRVLGDSSVSGSVRLSAREAWVRAARAVGESVSKSDVTVVGTRGGWKRLAVDGLDQRQSVRAVAFPSPKAGALRAYETVVSDRAAGEGYWQVVDAASGAVLFRESVVDHAADNPKWKTFPASPRMTLLNRYPWNYPSTDIRDIWCWLDAAACELVLENPASPNPWDVEGTGVVSFTTSGNNARAQENWNDPFFPGGATQPPPTSPTRDYVYPWSNVWFESECDPANFVPGGNDIDAATVALFAAHNRVHDWSFHLGFDTTRWNAQDNNYGTGTLGNDRILGDVQAGAIVGGFPNYAGRDNANMFTQPDGTVSWSNMYLWQPLAGAFYAPCVDGDYDTSVIGHEYGHMIENRMIGKGDRRMGHHAGAMGESFGDLNGMEYLNEYDYVPVSGESPYAVGPYVTGNPIRGIRNYNMSFPSTGRYPEPGRYVFVNPLNFSDIGYDLTGPQVHADGEIWSATNFDLRELFLERYPGGRSIQRQCADGERPADECPGNRRWFQLYYDAMVLMPVAPSMLDARDAILAADVMRFGGANQDLLWRGFARRGFGENAFSTNDSRNDSDTDPIPSFESPLHGEATVVFNAVAQDGGAPVNARIYVGHYEARVSPIADTDPATGGAENLDDVARFVPDDRGRSASKVTAYEFVAHAQGYGHVRFRLDNLRAGDTETVTIHFPDNVASRYQGAVASGDGTRHLDLIDDTEGSNWESVGRPAPGNQVLIELDGEQRFKLAKVSAALRPARTGELSQSRFTALRSFELWACTAGEDRANPACATDTMRGWKRILRSRGDAFPGDNPRPVAPVLSLRTFEVPTTRATHVLFRVLHNQCTGQSSFQGEQDNDPLNTTDCRVGSGALAPRGEEVRAAEVELLDDRPRVDGAKAVE